MEAADAVVGDGAARARVTSPVLIVLSGRSGAGKTTIARALSREIGAVHVRIDSIEQALRNAGVTIYDHGYVVGYAVAEDNLRLGRAVVADSVNPWPLTRTAWRDVAARAGVPALDVEIVCSDAAEHRRRAEHRQADIRGHVLPTWTEVLERDYRDWDTGRLVVDTAGQNVDDCLRTIIAALM